MEGTPTFTDGIRFLSSMSSDGVGVKANDERQRVKRVWGGREAGRQKEERERKETAVQRFSHFY